MTYDGMTAGRRPLGNSGEMSEKKVSASVCNFAQILPSSRPDEGILSPVSISGIEITEYICSSPSVAAPCCPRRFSVRSEIVKPVWFARSRVKPLGRRHLGNGS